MPVLSSELTLTSITTSPQMCWLTTRVRPLTCHRHDARDLDESVPCTCDEGIDRAHVCTLTISSVPNHVAVHVDNRDLQKANGKLGVTAWRCETLCAIRQPAWTCGPGASAAPSALTPLACACVSNSVEAKCNNFPKRQARSGPLCFVLEYFCFPANVDACVRHGTGEVNIGGHRL